MKFTIGFVVGVLALIVFMSTRANDLKKEVAKPSLELVMADSLRETRVKTQVFDEYLRVKFDQCTP
ncbi:MULTISPECIES: hypothetical protein [unclassified Myroides]|uniref:hypothetical protein n=1 Tax=unclassified Myroides TaxID=2642485 RepID=UPI0015F8801E|nr:MULTISPECIES: hypothetical protein [unclassified Myroides]MBB1149678.1 hypothetical protein [Myroides sp. NP-2]MDM1408828.1 hypothetical protein [Myroides sp. DF42-4-2]